MSKGRSINLLLAKSFLHLGLLMATCDIVREIHCMPTNGRTNGGGTGDHGQEPESWEHFEKVEIFKRDVLQKLGYARPPRVSNVTKSIEENRRMIRQYKRYIEERDQLRQAGADPDLEEDWEPADNRVQSKTFYSVHNEGLVPHLVGHKDWMVAEAFRFYFGNLPSHPDDDQNAELHVDSARLRVFVKNVKPENIRDKHTVEKNIRLNAYQVLSIQNKTAYARTLLDSILVSLDETGWVSFDVSKALQSWVDDSDSNLGIEIASDSQNIREVLDIDTLSIGAVSEEIGSSEGQLVGSVNSTTATSPVLHIYAQTRHLLKRVKRSSRRKGICRRKDNETGCCRYPIKISFKDIGWDWILAPLEYKGYYCAGSCEHPHKLANTFAGIKVFLHQQKPKKVPAPCCHAAKLSPFTILHFDEKERYTFTDIADMVVEQCKCG